MTPPVTPDDEGERSNGGDARAAKKEKKKERSSHKKKRERRPTMDADADVDATGGEEEEKKRKKKEKKKKKKKKDEKSGKRKMETEEEDVVASSPSSSSGRRHKRKRDKTSDERMVSSSAVEFYPERLKRMQAEKNETDGKAEDAAAAARSDVVDGEECDGGDDGASKVTLLLFYQYVEPPWDDDQHRRALAFVTTEGEKCGLTGRMRVAKEGLNCTLTGTSRGVRQWCASLRTYDGGRSSLIRPDDPEFGQSSHLTEFARTEFKLTDDLPPRQRFAKLHPFEVSEIVNYGLGGKRAPDIRRHGGTHLEPEEYHAKMAQKDTVIIDVRNHYEANIGRFDPPEGGAAMIDPMMRKSTEFPVWLDRPETKELLRGKQVLMYCTGGVRCERASALLKQKIDTEEDTKSLGIKGVYQLQGGVDKYFKKFPDGGLWKGKNYVFDKRFAHAPPEREAVDRTRKSTGNKGMPILLGEGDGEGTSSAGNSGGVAPSDHGEEEPTTDEILGRCEACAKPWDMYRGKRRCPTCGVPSLICRECFEADKSGAQKLRREVRCDLCVTERITAKRTLKDREKKEMHAYEKKVRGRETDDPDEKESATAAERVPRPNPEKITRLFLKNMCAKKMDESGLVEALRPAEITHVQWITERGTGKFYGAAFVEAASPEDASMVAAADGCFILGRRLKVKYQRADSKDVWPLSNTAISAK